MEKKLIKIPLQFFGEGAEDFDDDLDGDESYDDGFDDEDTEENETEDGEDAPPTDSDGGDANEDGASDGTDDNAGSGSATDENNELMVELRALGFSGDDLTALIADMKAKRKDKEKAAAAKARQADLAQGKAHVKGSKPSQRATGGGAAGVSDRRVSDFAERMGCSKQRARELLEKHAKKIGG